jgi:hypothetical protein
MGDEVDEACNTHGREDKCLHFLLEYLQGRDHSEDIGVDGEVILEWILGWPGKRIVPL